MVIRSKKIVLVFAAIAILALRWHSALPEFDESYIGSYIGKNITVRGVALEPTNEIEVRSFEYYGNRYQLHGRLDVPSYSIEDVKYGDVIDIGGLLEKSFRPDPRIGAFISRPYYKIVEHGMGGSRFLAALIRARGFLIKRLESLLPEPGASFAAGLLLGARSSIPKQVVLDFKRSGLTHIVALSGFNIVILIGFVATLCAGLPRKISTLIAIVIITIFIMLVGGSASVIRAGIMGCLGLIARMYGRQSTGLRTLFSTAYLMALVDPFILVYDIGFQLSFGATAGIMLFTNKFQEYLSRMPNWFLMRDSLATTTAAQVLTLPLIIFYFKGFSIIAPAANIVVLPFIPLLMLGSFLSLIGGQIIAAPTWLLFELVLFVVHFFAGLPFAFTEVGIS